MSRRILALAALVALSTWSTAVAAPQTPQTITVVPTSPAPGGAYHVIACIFAKSTASATVIVSGPRDSAGNSLPETRELDRRAYPTDANGCIDYDAVAPPTAGYYLLEFLEPKGRRVLVAGSALLDVR